MLKPEPVPHSASTAAARVQQQPGLNMSLNTMTRSFRNSGLQHLRPGDCALLDSQKNKAARFQFAKAALSQAFSVLITDSLAAASSDCMVWADHQIVDAQQQHKAQMANQAL